MTNNRYARSKSVSELPNVVPWVETLLILLFVTLSSQAGTIYRLSAPLIETDGSEKVTSGNGPRPFQVEITAAGEVQVGKAPITEDKLKERLAGLALGTPVVVSPAPTTHSEVTVKVLGLCKKAGRTASLHVRESKGGAQ